MTPVSVIWRLCAALALGVFFYAGLRFTVERLPQTRHPILLTLSSFWVRTIAIVAAFLFMSKEHWQYAVICLVGFTLGRAVVMKILAPVQAGTKCT